MTAQNWTNYNRRVDEIEKDMWDKEQIIDRIHEEFVPIIIRPFDDQPDDEIEEDFNEDEENCEE